MFLNNHPCFFIILIKVIYLYSKQYENIHRQNYISILQNKNVNQY